jgi:hypothetical protein
MRRARGDHRHSAAKSRRYLERCAERWLAERLEPRTLLTAPPLDPPSTPDLIASCDSGASAVDNITNFNNATAATALQFSVSSAVAGNTIELLFDGAIVGSAVASADGSATVAVATGTTVADGVHTVTARQTDDVAGDESADSPALSLTIDTIAPAAPGLPDLEAASDSGFSNTDDNTSVAIPKIDVTASEPGVLHLLVDSVAPLKPTLSVSGAGMYTFIGASPWTSPFRPYHSMSTVGFASRVAAGDLNSDGAVDLAVSTTNGKLSVFLNQGAGVFPAAPTSLALSGTNAGDVVITDVNGDGNNDVLVANGSAQGVSLFLGSATGALQPQQIVGNIGTTCTSLVAGDFNNDGKMDVAAGGAASATGTALAILFGNGDGTFQLPLAVPTVHSVTDLHAVDFNRDGHADLVFTGSVNPSSNVMRLLLGVGNGTFTNDEGFNYGAVAPTTVAVGDFNGDGWLDLEVPRPSGGGAGDAYFSSVTGSTVTYGSIGDIALGFGTVDRTTTGKVFSDSKDDIIYTNGTSNINNVYPTAGTATAPIVADVNGDGRADLIAVNSGGAISIVASGMLDGVHHVNVFAEDLAGNQSPNSPTLTVTIDTTSPTAPGAILESASDSGVLSSDRLTNVTQPKFDVGVTSAGFIRLFVDGSEAAKIQVPGTGSYPIAPGLPLADGTHTIAATVEDLAGNVSSMGGSPSVTISTTIPAAPTGAAPKLSVSTDSGVSNSDGITSITQPSFSIPINSGAPYFRVYRSGNVLASYTSGTNFTPTATLPTGTWTFWITNVDAAGNESSPGATSTITIDNIAPATPPAPDLDASADSGASNTDNITNVTKPLLDIASTDSYWILLRGQTVISGGNFSSGSSFTDNAAPTGSVRYQLEAVDAAGNISFASPLLSITIDTVAPAPPRAPDLQGISDSGISLLDNITNVTKPAFNLSGGESGSLMLFIDGTLAGTVNTTTGGGAVTVATALSEGVHACTAEAVDLAGNVSAASAALSVTIDTTPPAVSAPPQFTVNPTEQVIYSFSENVQSSVTVSDIQIQNLTTGNPVPDVVKLLSYSTLTNTATLTFNGLLGDANYRATLAAGAVNDVAGNLSTADSTFDFFVFEGDTNFDRTVNVADLANLAGNFGMTAGATWLQGDFDFNGTVNVADLADLAGNFGKDLAASTDSPTTASNPEVAPINRGQAVVVSQSTSVPSPAAGTESNTWYDSALPAANSVWSRLPAAVGDRTRSSE